MITPGSGIDSRRLDRCANLNQKLCFNLRSNPYPPVSATLCRLSTNSNAPTGQSHSILNSWKEIARYLGRGVRTLQRWEQELQLPVHRIGSGRRAPAVVSELKFWMVTSARTARGDREKMPPDSSGRKREAQLTARLHQLAQAVAESSVRQQRQAEALEKNILALRSRFSPRKSK
jgi:hypothetical protein